MKKSFMNYLEERFTALHPQVLDDNMPDAFNGWLDSLDGQEIIDFAEAALIEAYDLMDLKTSQ